MTAVLFVLAPFLVALVAWGVSRLIARRNRLLMESLFGWPDGVPPRRGGPALPFGMEPPPPPPPPRSRP